MKYILEGPQADVVLQENRYRIAMGMVKITPVADEVEETPEEKKAESEVEDTKEAPVEDTKEVPAEVEKAEPEVEDTKDVAPADEKKPAKKAKK